MSPPIAHCERFIVPGYCDINKQDPWQRCEANTCPRLSEEVRGVLLACESLLKAKRPACEH